MKDIDKDTLSEALARNTSGDRGSGRDFRGIQQAYQLL